MYRPYATPLRLDFRPSALAGTWLLVTHLSALIMLLACRPGLLTAILAIAGLAASLGHAWRRYVTRGPARLPAGLVWQAGDQLQVIYNAGPAETAELLRKALVLPWLVVLYCRIDGRTRCLAVFADMLDHDSWRRLRVRLRLTFSQAQEHPAH